MKDRDFNGIIEKLKNDFSGSNDYLSGVNDGMYHLMHKLKEYNYVVIKKTCKNAFINHNSALYCNRYPQCNGCMHYY
jgi:hypothetical protein